MKRSSLFTGILLLLLCNGAALATKLLSVRPLDSRYLQVHFRDGYTEFEDNATGPSAYWGHPGPWPKSTQKYYGSALNTSAAQNTGTYTISSNDDPNYAGGKSPQAAHRKSKVSSVSHDQNSSNDHWIFLQLPHALQQGKTYSISIGSQTNTDATEKRFTYDIFSEACETDAIHINLIGYNPKHTVAKTADLYMYMGDGGHRDFSDYEGADVIAYNVDTQEKITVGSVAKWWDAGGSDVGGKILIRSPVWNCDLSPLAKPGVYRIAIPGVGCSKTFGVADTILHEAFKMNVRGYYYMRIGQGDVNGIKPVPRIPLWIPGKSPSNCVVYITTANPWDGMPSGGGDMWDNAAAWAGHSTGRTNDGAWGGHSDAFDWDRHAAHVGNIFDMLLPYILHQGKSLNDDNLDIAESGDGIPDLLQEAAFETDFWLRLRDGDGYGSGLTNPVNHKTGSPQAVLYQAGNHKIMAWANAAFAAMQGEGYRLANQPELAAAYRDSAIFAYDYAGSDALQTRLRVESGVSFRGKDFKMIAAAYLYNLTGDTRYEDDLAAESVVSSSGNDTQTPLQIISEGNYGSTYNQLYGAAAYLLTNQTVNYPQLQQNLRACVVNQAINSNADLYDRRPSRRTTYEEMAMAYWQSGQNLERACVAHAVVDPQDTQTRQKLLRALISETDWGLGRNPMNRIQMTGPLNGRYLDNTYTTGQNDGTPGVHPGHTPYMTYEDWWSGAHGAASWYGSRGYPSNFTGEWPLAETHWNSRFLCPTGEFTPRQTMKGKIALVSYLYGLSKSIPTSIRHGENGFKPATGAAHSAATTRDVTLTMGVKKTILKAPVEATSLRVLSLQGKKLAELPLGRSNSIALAELGRGLLVVQFNKAGVSVGAQSVVHQ